MKVLASTGVIYLAFYLFGYSQSATTQQNREKIHPDILLGEWEKIDTPFAVISFIDSTDIVLKISDAEIYFFLKDTSGFVSSNGFYPMWPPPNCDLFFISNDTLQITFSNFSNNYHRFFYKRKKN